MKFTLDQRKLVITLKGFEQFLSFKNHLFVDKEHITDVTWHHSFDDWKPLEIRLPGTGAPGALIAGSFWTPEGWDFIYVRRPHGFFRPKAVNVIVIETNLHRYHRIIISCPPKQADEIIRWWHAK